jgi:drug/metabolite transporter (DMT)-like permease
MKKTHLVWLLLCLIWGSTWVFIKIGLRDLPPFTFAGVRLLIAAVLLWLYVAVRRQRLPRGARQWGWVAIASLLFAFNMGSLFWGEHRTTSGLAAVLQATIPVFGFLLAHYLIPGERITPAKVFGLTLGFAGVGIIFSNQVSFEGRDALLGSLAIVVGALAVAVSNIIVKRYCPQVLPAVLASAQMTISALPLLLIGVIGETNFWELNWTASAIISLLYLATVGSAIAFLLYFWLLQYLALTRTMLVALVTPIAAVLIGMVTLGEKLTWRLSLGTIAILSGVAIIIFMKPTKKSGKV